MPEPQLISGRDDQDIFVSQHSRKPHVVCSPVTLTGLYKLETNRFFHTVLNRVYCSKSSAIKHVFKLSLLFKLSVELIGLNSVYEIRGMKLGCGRVYSVAQ